MQLRYKFYLQRFRLEWNIIKNMNSWEYGDFAIRRTEKKDLKNSTATCIDTMQQYTYFEGSLLLNTSLIRFKCPLHVSIRPSLFWDFKETINHLIIYHHDRENKSNKKWTTLCCELWILELFQKCVMIRAKSYLSMTARKPLKCQSPTKFKSTVPLKQHVNKGHKKTQITDSLRKVTYQHVVALKWKNTP